MRTRSLKQDVADDNAFRHARDRMVGVCVETEFHQHCPHFFTRDRAALTLEGLYRGASVFLICNGPSFAKLNHDLLKEPGVMTFGINNGPRTFKPNFWTCVDDPSRFIKSIWLDPKITKFIPQSHMEKKIFDNEKWENLEKKVGECPNVIGYCRNEKFHAARFLTENSIGWGNHADYGGGRSVMLPAIRICHLLGFRKIFLLGCDMNMSETNTYHFEEQRSKGAVKCNMKTYDRLKNEYLPGIKPYLEEDGCFIYNCYQESALKCFDYVPFEDAVSQAQFPLGDYKNERTFGMYSKPEDKMKMKNVPEQVIKKTNAAITGAEGVPCSGLVGTEHPHPMLCFQHGGSEACEAENRKYGFTCPKCSNNVIQQIQPIPETSTINKVQIIDEKRDVEIIDAPKEMEAMDEIPSNTPIKEPKIIMPDKPVVK